MTGRFAKTVAAAAVFLCGCDVTLTSGVYRCDTHEGGVRGCPPGWRCVAQNDGSGLCFPRLPDGGTDGANPAACGNNVVDQGEPCDGADLSGFTCTTLGFEGGVLTCNSRCEYDTSGCTGGPECGNETVEGTEDCDGTNLGGETCLSLGLGGGTLSCKAGRCTFDVSGCDQRPECGNLTRDPGEECDGEDLGGMTCADLAGFSAGDLSCTAGCAFDTAQCAVCGDSVCEGLKGENSANCGEECGWIHISAGTAHTCAVRVDNTVWCWGANDYGQLGDGTDIEWTAPVQVADLGAVLFVSAAGEHTCALTSAGNVWCWGNNMSGQLGVADAPDSCVAGADCSRTPVQSTPLASADQVTCGGGIDVLDWAHSCALTLSGVIFCWGNDRKGQLGDSTALTDQFQPVEVANLANVARVASGYAHTCALEGTAGWAFCWGSSSHGQLGVGAGVTESPVPAALNVDAFAAIAGGKFHTCGVKTDGYVWCWGSNQQGQLGVGTAPEFCGPDPCATAPVAATGLGGRAQAVTAGESHTCALMVDGTVQCWGGNANGQLGNGTTVSGHVAEPAQGLADVVFVSAGAAHTCALRSNNTIWCWGSRGNGRLGDGLTASNVLIPQFVPDPPSP